MVKHSRLFVLFFLCLALFLSFCVAGSARTLIVEDDLDDSWLLDDSWIIEDDWLIAEEDDTITADAITSWTDTCYDGSELLDNLSSTFWYKKTGEDDEMAVRLGYDLQLFYMQKAIGEIWIRNGAYTSQQDYYNYGRAKVISVTITYFDQAEYTLAELNYRYQLTDVYDPYTNNDSWKDGYQLVQFPDIIEGVLRIDLKIESSYPGQAQPTTIAISDIRATCEDRDIVVPAATTAPEIWYPPVTAPTATPEPWYQPMVVVTPTEEPWYPPVVVTPVPTPEPVPVITMTLNVSPATRSGPNSKFDEYGTFPLGGKTVTAISRSYDVNNGIWWIQIEFNTNGKLVRAYVTVSSLRDNLGDLPEEEVLNDSAMIRENSPIYAGPGTNYARANFADSWMSGTVYSGTKCSVYAYENGFAQIEYRDTDAYLYRRVWVPVNVLTY